jgi:hypothetical protein
MMTRTQVSLDPELLRQARRRAAERGISLAEYFRSLLVRDLGGGSAPAEPSFVFDLGGSGGSDVARDKHRMIGEAIARRKRS